MDIFSFIFGSLIFLTNKWADIFKEADFNKFIQESGENSNHNLPTVETYDFVIVGGGLAGCVLASSLSRFHSVLVLELGGDPPPTTYVPAYGPYINDDERIAFVHKSSPHLFAGLENGGVLNVETGKVLGGGTTLNGHMYNRGSPYDYDNWANKTKDQSWNYANILSLFRDIEKYEGKFPIGNEHGISGPVTVSESNYTPGLSVWLEAGKELGFNKKDPNGPQMIGFSPVEFNIKFGRRDSAYTAFLQPALGRSSLTVRRFAVAEEIILDSQNKKAIGVRYSRHSTQDQLAIASKEVIISAGAFGTPKLLLKSGIGPTQHLMDANIKQKVNLPVGENFQDHPILSIQARVNASALPHLFFPERDYTLESLSEFRKNGTGPLTYATAGGIGLGFIASSRTKKLGYPEWPDIQLALQSHYPPAKLNDSSTYTISIFMTCGRPTSRGYVRLNTTNPSGPLDFGFGFYADNDNTDMDVTLDAIRFTIRMFENTTAYGSLGARVVKDIIPGCKGFEWGSEAYWRCYIRQRTSESYHPVGSCPMGYGVDDPTAVVDSKMKVIGVERLRVIDSSIMPYITNSNTQAPTFMIAKKGAQEILSTWTIYGKNK